MAQFYNMLQTMLAYVYPCAVTSAAECFVSIKRIQNFLLLEEKDKPIAILDSDAEMRANLYSKKSFDFFSNPGITKEDSGFVNHCKLTKVILLILCMYLKVLQNLNLNTCTFTSI